MKYKNVCPRCGSKFEVIPSGAMCLDFYLKCRKCGYTNEPIYINKEQNNCGIESNTIVKYGCLNREI